ncbi:MAG: response regulator [Actinobacteria bacterium]|nr:response regulator [Actinomycetota bacterium]
MARILVIEDEPGVAEILQVNLVASGHAVRTVGDGQAALALLDAPPPDLLLLDLNLPCVSGFRFMDVMRRTPGWEDVPVVVVTAFNFEEAVDVVRGGVDEFVTKPFDVRDVLAAVERAAARASLPREPPPRG